MLPAGLLKLLPVFNRLYITYGLLLLNLLAVIPTSLIRAQEIKVGILSNTKPSQLIISVASGAYAMRVQDKDTLTLKVGESLYILAAEGNLNTRCNSLELFGDSLVSLIPAVPGAVLKVQARGTTTVEYWYEGSVAVRPKGDFLQLLNLVDLESYIGGVVEAETGGQQTKEFYKVQACITRTFALANLKKHLLEGFNVCDQVHCQVYRGRPRSNAAIPQAVAETDGVVIVDRNLQLVDAVFHANCGGQTHNSEDYWVDTVSYLRSVKDPYCHEGLQYTWQQTLPKDKWLRYLYGNYNFPIDSVDQAAAACNFIPTERAEFFLDKSYRMGLRRIRSDWNFRSTFFETQEQGDNVLIKGRGFGHGVGLCQEGAMKMAKLNISYSDILHFYFKDVFVIPKKQLLYLRTFLVN